MKVPTLLLTLALVAISVSAAPTGSDENTLWERLSTRMSNLLPTKSFRKFMCKVYGSCKTSTPKPAYPQESLIPPGYNLYGSPQDPQFALNAAASNQYPFSSSGAEFYPNSADSINQANQYAYGTYNLAQAQQAQQQQVPSGGGQQSAGPQPQYAFPPGYGQQGQQAVQGPGYYYKGQYGQQGVQGQQQQGPYQQDETASQVAFQSPDQPSSIPAADQDGIYSAQQSQQQPSFDPQQQQNEAYQQAQQGGGPQQAEAYQLAQQGSGPQKGAQSYPIYSQTDQMMQSASTNNRAYGYRPQGYPAGRPYGSGGSPGTIDVHQVLDQFIRSAGLSPQGDHENVQGDHHYAESGLKPVFSMKKLYSYPFFASQSGDKPTSYGSSIRRQSIDEPKSESPKAEALTSHPAFISASRPVTKYIPKPQPQAQTESAQSKSEPESSTSAPTTSALSSAPSSSSSSADAESQFIAKQAQALQEFLATGKKSASANQQAHYYYQPAAQSSAEISKKP